MHSEEHLLCLKLQKAIRENHLEYIKQAAKTSVMIARLRQQSN